MDPWIAAGWGGAGALAAEASLVVAHVRGFGCPPWRTKDRTYRSTTPRRLLPSRWMALVTCAFRTGVGVVLAGALAQSGTADSAWLAVACGATGPELVIELLTRRAVASGSELVGSRETS